jgi:hypothetical protein
VHGEEQAGAAPHRVRPLGLGPDHEAGLVDEVDDRKAELIAGVDEARLLVRGVPGQAAAVVLGVGGDHATGRPARRASAVIEDPPKRRPSSKTEPRSKTSSRTRRIL